MNHWQKESVMVLDVGWGLVREGCSLWLWHEQQGGIKHCIRQCRVAV
jgi:hypothetical protein